MLGLIDIEPKQYLDFVQQLENTVAHCTLTLNNLQDTSLTYKIKTTSPNLFQVKPSIGVIMPKQTIQIDIQTSQPIKDDDRLDSKFQINATKYDSEGGITATPAELSKFWHTVDAQQIQQLQLKSRVRREAAPLPSDNSLVQSLHEGNPLYKSAKEMPQQPQQTQQQPQPPPQIPQLSTSQQPRDDETQRLRNRIDELEKELSNWKMNTKSQIQQQQVAQDQGARIELKHLMMAMVVALFIGMIMARK